GSDSASRDRRWRRGSAVEGLRLAEPVAERGARVDVLRRARSASPRADRHGRSAGWPTSAGVRGERTVVVEEGSGSAIGMEYRTLSLVEVSAGLDAVAHDAEQTFGPLDATQLNWRPDDTRWSVAQCFEHLVTINGFMLRAAESALDGTASPNLWQHV